MAILPNTRTQHVKGQADHVDAWLMSYADLITLLFMFFVIFVSVTPSRHNQPSALTTQGEPEHPYLQERFGLLNLGTIHDDVYRSLKGMIIDNHADQNIAVEKTDHGLSIDLSTIAFFEPGSADIPEEQRPLLKTIAHTLNQKSIAHYRIEVEGHTDDGAIQNSQFADNWDLAAMRATSIVRLLIAEGVDPLRLRATSFAGTHPLVPNMDIYGASIPENRQRNQRIVIKVESDASSAN